MRQPNYNLNLDTTVQGLRTICESAGISKTGSKASLVARIADEYKRTNGAAWMGNVERETAYICFYAESARFGK